MSKLITLTVLAFAALVVLASDVEAAGRRRCPPTYYTAPAPVAVAPAATQTTASAQGYRTFSYQPSYQPVAPGFRSYSAPRKQSWDYPKTDARRYSNVR